MTKTLGSTDKNKATRARNAPKARGDLHVSRSTMDLVPMAIRVERKQAMAMDALAAALMMHKSDIIRKSFDLGIEWAKKRAEKLG